MEHAIPLAGRAPTVPWYVWVRLIIVGALIFLWERRAVPPPSPSITRNEIVFERSTNAGATKSHVMCQYGPEIVLVLPATKRCPVALKELPEAPK